jgi:hypothetical protein
MIEALIGLMLLVPPPPPVRPMWVEPQVKSRKRYAELDVDLDLVAPLTLYGLSAAGDLSVTAWAEKRGATEANPLAKDKTARYAISAAVFAGLVALDAKLQQAGHRGMARALRILTVLVRGYVVFRNVYLVRESR